MTALLDLLAPPPIVLEHEQPLSRSMLWQLQRAFFAQQGIEAWRQGTVPHYVTSNPFIADAYAHVVAAYAQEHPDQPLHIVELGAGSGRFAFHFLKAFLPLHRRARAAPVRYVMTDLVADTVAFWRAHPPLQPFVEAGVLDFAQFDVERDRELHLEVSGDVLGGDRPAPLVVIANYVFDGVPLDVFRVEHGRLDEGLVSVLAPADAPPADDPAVLSRARLAYTYRPAADAPYDDPDFNRVLAGYRTRTSRAIVRFPVAALACCRSLIALSGGRMLLLTADKGSLEPGGPSALHTPQLTVHGSFSLDVDYHAIAEYLRLRGGELLGAPRKNADLVVAGFLVGQASGDCPATRHAFDDAIARFGPDDFFALKRGFEIVLGALDLDALLAFLRLARGDARLLRQCLPHLARHAAIASDRARADLIDVLDQTWDRYYDFDEPYDLAFEIGFLLTELRAFAEAGAYFERSLARRGDNPHVAFNLALCHYRRHRLAEACAWALRTLALDPAHTDAKAMRDELTLARPG